MVTANFIKAVHAGLTNAVASRPPKNIIDINGNLYASARATSTSGILYATNTLFADLSTGFNGGLFVGTGGTEATFNDINLESRIADSELIPGSMVMSLTSDGKILLTRVFTYTGADEKEIKEIGFFTSWTISTSTDFTPFLLAREVLVNPIKITNNKTFSASTIID